MPTRFYFPAEGSGAPTIPNNPGFDAGWEQTGQATRLNLLRKSRLSTPSTIADNGSRTVPITTTQDVLCNQFISEPLPAGFRFDTSMTFSLVIRAFENATTNNVTLAVVVKVISQDGLTVRGTLFSTFNTDTEFAVSASAATRIVNAQALTALTTQPGDRLVVEIGGHAAAPTAAGSYTMRQGNSAASDFALTSGLTTDLNPWCEFSAVLWDSDLNNYRSVRADTGISVAERVR